MGGLSEPCYEKNIDTRESGWNCRGLKGQFLKYHIAKLINFVQLF